jgi:hypothetical protein
MTAAGAREALDKPRGNVARDLAQGELGPAKVGQESKTSYSRDERRPERTLRAGKFRPGWRDTDPPCPDRQALAALAAVSCPVR